MEWINFFIEYWIGAHWLMALMMSFAVNLLTYFMAAACFEWFFKHLIQRQQIGSYVDSQPLKERQKLTEIKFGVMTCLVLAAASLLTRFWYTGIWPQSMSEVVTQSVLFLLFYECYSYFIHRLLHHRWFIRVHRIHHQSVRVTPWTAYSVHPIEGLFIGISAPLFMLMLPLSLGLALCFHLLGMVFTIFIHSNFQLNGRSLIKSLLSGATYHVQHHQNGQVNFGFINPLLDWIFQTRR